VVPAQFAGAPALLPLQPRRRGEDAGGWKKRSAQPSSAALEPDDISFEFRKQRFVYDAAEGVFAQQRYPCDASFAAYAASRGLATPGALGDALATFGANSFAIPELSFGRLLAEQLSAPFFVFQLFCVALWCFDEYWMYALFTLAMLVVFEATVAATRQRTARELRAQGAPAQGLMAFRQGVWCPLGAAALLPGDVVSVGRPRGGPAALERCVLPADLLLLAGSAITEEALLTGETAPQWKTAAPGGASASGGGDDDVLDMRRHRQHILFGGTKVVQHVGDPFAQLRTPDGGCLAIVLRTGFGTEQGKLMRTIMFSTEAVSANSREAGLFILLLLVFAITAAGCDACACLARHTRLAQLLSLLPADVHLCPSAPAQLCAAPWASGPAAQPVEALPAHHHDRHVGHPARAAA
jgi:cation-transporting ATPase 13A1